MDNAFSSDYNILHPQFDVYDRSFDEDEKAYEIRRKLYYPRCYSYIPSTEEVEHWTAVAPRAAVSTKTYCAMC